jgi:excisionase family DNA binding protein
VSAKTVSRWAQSGRLPGFHTPGGHYRFKRSDVEALYNEHSRSRRSEKSREGM